MLFHGRSQPIARFTCDSAMLKLRVSADSMVEKMESFSRF